MLIAARMFTQFTITCLENLLQIFFVGLHQNNVVKKHTRNLLLSNVNTNIVSNNACFFAVENRDHPFYHSHFIMLSLLVIFIPIKEHLTTPYIENTMRVEVSTSNLLKPTNYVNTFSKNPVLFQTKTF